MRLSSESVIRSGRCGSVALLGALLFSLCGAKGEAQPPGDRATVRGTVRSFTTAPKGETDGMVLDDGTMVHWPPHVGVQISGLIAKKDKVKATGRMETSPEGEARLEAEVITNVRTGESVSVADVPPPGPRGKKDKAKGPPPPPSKDRRVAAAAGDEKTVRGTVQRLTTAPKGEVDGAILDDGTVIHWPPHLEATFKPIVSKGDRVKASGWMETGPKGDTHLEVQTVTNLRTNASADNDGPRRPAANPSTDREQRLRAIEEQMEQLQREIQRLRRDK